MRQLHAEIYQKLKIGNRPITGEKADADKKLAVFCHAYRQNQLWG